MKLLISLLLLSSLTAGCVNKIEASSLATNKAELIIGKWTNQKQRWVFNEDGVGFFEILDENYPHFKFGEKFKWKINKSLLNIESPDGAQQWYSKKYSYKFFELIDGGIKLKLYLAKENTNIILIKKK